MIVPESDDDVLGYAEHLDGPCPSGHIDISLAKLADAVVTPEPKSNLVGGAFLIEPLPGELFQIVVVEKGAIALTAVVVVIVVVVVVPRGRWAAG
jgi:hypothetical protein